MRKRGLSYLNPDNAMKVKSLLDVPDRLVDTTVSKSIRPLSHIEAKYLIGLVMRENRGHTVTDLSLPDFPSINGTEPPLALRILFGRLKALSPNIKVAQDLLVFLALLSSSPGIAVMWAYTLHKMQKPGELLTLTEWSASFPYGVPTNEAYRAIWDAQKGRNNGDPKVDNYLDMQETWSV